jgi:hypothetical protein
VLGCLVKIAENFAFCFRKSSVDQEDCERIHLKLDSLSEKTFTSRLSRFMAVLHAVKCGKPFLPFSLNGFAPPNCAIKLKNLGEGAQTRETRRREKKTLKSFSMASNMKTNRNNFIITILPFSHQPYTHSTRSPRSC